MSNTETVGFLVTAICCAPIALVIARFAANWADKKWGPNTFFPLDPVFYGVFAFTWFGVMVFVMLVSWRLFPPMFDEKHAI